MKIAVGCDPNAQAYKEEMIEYIKSLGHEVTDFGSDDVIYAHVATKVAEAVSSRRQSPKGYILSGHTDGLLRFGKHRVYTSQKTFRISQKLHRT